MWCVAVVAQSTYQIIHNILELLRGRIPLPCLPGLDEPWALWPQPGWI